jgi:cell volume regulation protein A
MPGTEPLATAILLTTFGLLLGISAVFSHATERFSVPLALIFLGIGMLAGEEGLGGIVFANYQVAYRLGIVALVLILFDGGLNTPYSAVRRHIRPAALLATLGVLATAFLVAAGGRLLGFSWPAALLIGAVVSSTDAAAVFSVLRGSGLHLKRRVGATLELESGINDPMAVILTVLSTANLLAPGALNGIAVAVAVVRELVVGLLFGYAVGLAGRALFRRVRLPVGGLYPALTVALAFLAYGLPTLFHGSGFLSVYVASVTLGSTQLPYRAGLYRFHDALAWLSQVTMFLVLGLLVTPSHLASVAPKGLALAAILAVIARPLAVSPILAAFRYPGREIGYVSWVGLRGAVPIILATYPVLLSAPGADIIFDLVFFVVVVNTLVTGATIPWVTRRLGLESREPAPPGSVVALDARASLKGDLHGFYLDEALPVVGITIEDLPLPEDAAVSFLVRHDELLPPKPDTVLQAGDYVYLVARNEDLPEIHLLLGRERED